MNINFLNLPELKLVDQTIQQAFRSEAPQLHEISSYLHNLGGKRIRPALTILAARAFSLTEANSDLIKVAAGVELIHQATLIHDDIIDNSKLRRKQLTVHEKYGTGNALITGDFLLTRAFGLCGQLSKEIIAATEQACIDLTEGEILEAPLASQKFDLKASLNIARKKTAALFRLACFSGSTLAGASPKAVKALADYGETLGIIFQVLDDILDVEAEQEQFGKIPGTDIREKKPSAVNVIWLEEDPENSKILYKREDITPAEISAALATLRGSNTLKRAKELALELADSAKNNLKIAATDPKASTATIKILDQLIDYVISRSQ